MKIDLRSDCGAVDFEELAKLIRAAGLTPHTAEEYGKAFRNSHTAVFAYDGGRLVGCGRALSDGALQAAVYDIAVLPEYQGIGIGRRIVTAILERTKGCGCILFANPGKEPFYRKLNFGSLKTGMGLFPDMESMRRRGFLE
ncbi:MAG TPA: GNAT family N-acetyltransferase [Ruminococcaceae bacterium]|nr:GNAT family N-acetyltransferase [Oscillospiraceae bacterium]